MTSPQAIKAGANYAAELGYSAAIGIECHVQLKTATKLFSGANNDAREAAPNTLVNHIDFGLPGALPVLNKEAVHLAAKAAFALNSVPQKFSKFDRKHYFYPDLPLGYQITQFDEPIILGGSVAIEREDGTAKTIGITRAHLEADAGKSTHPAGQDYSLVDLNRAGTPLLEIVSEPDMHTAVEARAYARELYLRMKFSGVSEADLYYGNMRFDVNVSVSRTSTLGTRTETKNINSIRAVEKVVDYEIRRQIEVLEDGGQIIQETRGWDDAKLITVSQRTKEDAHDYRYFPDPDLPPITLTDGYIERVRAEMPRLPQEWRQSLQGRGLEPAQIETLLDAKVEFVDFDVLQLVERGRVDPEIFSFTAKYVLNTLIPLLRNGAVTMDQEHMFAAIAVTSELYKSGRLSSTNAKRLLELVTGLDQLPPDMTIFAANHELLQQSDETEILTIVDKILADNPKAAADVKGGEMKAIGFLVGQVMKASQGKANPALAQQLIKKQLGIQD